MTAQLPRRTRTPAAVTLAVFAQGFPVDEVILKAAHAQWLEALEAGLRGHTDASDPFDVARTAAQRMLGPFTRTHFGRRCLRSLHRDGGRARTLLLGALTATTAMMLTGRPGPPETLAACIEAAGAAPHLARRGTSALELAEGILGDPEAMQLLGALSLNGLAQAFAGASLEELEQARADLGAVLGWLAGPFVAAMPNQSAKDLVEEWAGEMASDWVNRSALGVAMLVAARHLLGSELERFSAWARAVVIPLATQAASSDLRPSDLGPHTPPEGSLSRSTAHKSPSGWPQSQLSRALTDVRHP